MRVSAVQVRPLPFAPGREIAAQFAWISKTIAALTLVPDGEVASQSKAIIHSPRRAHLFIAHHVARPWLFHWLIDQFQSCLYPSGHVTPSTSRRAPPTCA